MKNLKIIFLLMIVSSLLLAGCAKKVEESGTKEENQKEKIKAGFVFVGPVGDAGWTFAHNEGRMKMEKLPFVEKTTMIESVPEGAEAERTITQLAEQGFNLIFTTSYGYMDPTLKVAEKYPDKVFMHCSGYKTAKNMGAYFGKMYQAKYLAGIVAGKMTKSNKIGYVAPHPIPEVIRLANAFTLGAQSVNPDAEVSLVWTNSWFDPSKEREAADSMIETGCDIITQGADSAAPQQAAQEAGIYSIGYDSDMFHYAPKAHLTSAIWNWELFYNKVAKDVYEGNWKSENTWWGIETGLIGLSPYSEMVPQDVKDLVADAKAKIENNELKVFTGPIKNQKGIEKIKAGEELSDKDKLSMNWFVEGIKGSIPKEK